ncbi:MAG: aminomethyl-transferring glycine dehydrogenase subunit GcvPA, partial [Pseudomonadota bacterium]
MPFIPHTEADVEAMLATIGVADTEALFDEIPDSLRCDDLDVPAQMTEAEITRLMLERAARDGLPMNYIGAGAYEHHVPAAVWELATRGEFYSAYTPYQAEASQGTLQVIYEFQTMITGLTGLAVSNASLYDGASGLAEAVLMSIRGNRKIRSGRVLVADTVHPRYRKTTRAITHNQNVELVPLAMDVSTGQLDLDALDKQAGEFAAIVVQQPNFFGQYEQVDQLTDWAHARNALVIGVVNPLSLAVLRPPGEWGERGADIACGEGQPLGVPLSSGGPYYGFMACQKALMRQLPGRVVGRTVDTEGEAGMVLTLQAREQHIRRSKATSNICTNQGLAVTASTIFMSLLGDEGLAHVATHCIERTEALVERLTALAGVEEAFTGPRFHEAVLRLDREVGPVLKAL